MNWLALKKRTVIIAGLAVPGILTGLFVISWRLRVHENDVETANRLLGKWEVYLSVSPESPSTECIWEWHPDGRMEIYAPDGSSSYANQQNLESNWWVSNGNLIHQIKVHVPKGTANDVAEDIHVNSKSRFQIQWINEDTVRMQDITNESGDQILVLRRLNSRWH